MGGQMVDRVKLDFSAISQAVFSANFFEAQYHRLAAMGLSTRRIEGGGVRVSLRLPCGCLPAAEPRPTTHLSLFNPSHSFSVIGFQSFSV
jgi:hypothetical protein